MNTRSKQIGAVAWAALLFGAAPSPASAADTPPVIEQTATIEGGIAQEHPHPELKNWTTRTGQNKQFKIRFKFLRRYLRFFDMQGELFDTLQKPALFLINAEYDPLSDASFEIDEPCNSTLSKCVRVKNFPYAFGIHKLKNPDGTESPHAFLYVPARLESGTTSSTRPPYTGDSFALAVFHIPTYESDCDKLHHELSRSHCRLVYKLNQMNGKYSEGRFAIEVQQAYRYWIDHILDGASVDQSTGKLAFDGTPLADSANLTGFKPGVELYAKILQVILSHNEIIHGSLR